MKATRAKLGGIQKQRSSLTKKYNPSSKIAKKLNLQVKKSRKAKSRILKR